jgi:hypothetical protein
VAFAALARDPLPLRVGHKAQAILGEGARERGDAPQARPSCASPTWIKDLGNERDPLVGTQDGTFDMSIPNYHPHLPHYAVTTHDANTIRVLARQPIDPSRPHPFTEAGNKEFNMFLWMPPRGERAGDIVLADSTIFTTLFGGDESLERFWRNLVTR